ncbi:unnamed protein product [Trichobilharzia regenti]|nr:unnamed protein product [Trichobilharzia regenti]
MPKLSAKTVQSENNAPVSSTDCKLTDNTLTRANTLSTVGITNTISNSTTTSDDMIKKFESTDITTPTRTSHPGSVMKNNDPNFNITNSNNNNNSSFYSVPHNIPMNGNTTSSDLPERQRLKKLRNSRLMSNFNSTTDDSNHMRINKFMQTTSLLDYLSSKLKNIFFVIFVSQAMFCLLANINNNNNNNIIIAIMTACFVSPSGAQFLSAVLFYTDHTCLYSRHNFFF